jgi:hypothetical protein
MECHPGQPRRLHRLRRQRRGFGQRTREPLPAVSRKRQKQRPDAVSDLRRRRLGKRRGVVKRVKTAKRIFSRSNKKMYLIKAGEIELKNSKPLELKGRSQDFEQAKHKAHKLLKCFSQVEIIDSVTEECVHFLTRKGN